MSGEHRAPVDVLMLLVKAADLLLTKRAGNSYGSGWWAIPSGHVEAGEDVVSAAVLPARLGGPGPGRLRRVRAGAGFG
jgi:8-oxo-dGTP pyrophosphatase MutT (NUDIX family)